MPDNGIVYHYCSLEAFKSIIENKCLWLCDVQKSNDSEECLLFPSQIKEIAEETDFFADLTSWKKDSINLILQNLQVCSGSKIQHRTTFACCFSSLGDDLSQWRGYTPDATGLCIGFRKNYFEELAKPEWDFLLFSNVNYGLDQLIAAAHTELNHIRNTINNLDDNLGLEHNDTQLELLKIVHSIWERAALYKPSGFRAENEIRLIFSAKTAISRTINNNTIISLDRISSAEMCREGNFDLSPLKYRISNGQLQGYHELSFNHIKDKIICKIVIGPKCQVTEEDICLFLSANGFYHHRSPPDAHEHIIYTSPDEQDSLTVSRSELTYR